MRQCATLNRGGAGRLSRPARIDGSNISPDIFLPSNTCWPAELTETMEREVHREGQTEGETRQMGGRQR